MPRIGEALQAVGEDLPVRLFLFLLALRVVDSALAPDEGRRRRHHRDEVQLRFRPARHLAAVEQRLLPRFRSVVRQEDALVHWPTPTVVRVLRTILRSGGLLVTGLIIARAHPEGPVEGASQALLAPQAAAPGDRFHR